MGAPPRESGLAGTAQPEAPRPGPLAARPPAGFPGLGPAGGRRRRWARESLAGGRLTGRGAGGAGRRPGARGRPRRPSPRPGAEQREAAQAATGPAAARRPREAAERAPERLSLGLDGQGRSPVAPRLLTGGEESRDPGAPGRTAEMPQTDTAAILETVSSGRGEGRRGGGTAAGGGEASRGNGCLGEGAGTAWEGGEGEGEGEASRGAGEKREELSREPGKAGGRGGTGGKSRPGRSRGAGTKGQSQSGRRT